MKASLASIAASACLLAPAGLGCGPGSAGADAPDAVEVFPGDDIQAALDRAAGPGGPRRVRVHAGTYRPERPAQALVHFNRRHDGVVMEAVGDVTLTAANPERTAPDVQGYPAIANHVVFFGDGVGPETRLAGFRITGANHFVTRAGQIEPPPAIPELVQGLLFYTDGGGIKIWGRSYPTVERCVIEDNYASPCAGGVSIEHQGFDDRAPVFRDCVFRANRAEITGSAIDVLRGSSVVVENCLFVANVANLGEDYIGQRSGYEYNEQHGSGAITVFPTSRAVVRRSTFTDNWNGVDDKGAGNAYEDCIFWANTRSGGISPGERYELDILDASGVIGCFLGGGRADLRGTIDAERNFLNAPDPDFDASWVPRNPLYAGAGYRPRAD